MSGCTIGLGVILLHRKQHHHPLLVESIFDLTNLVVFLANNFEVGNNRKEHLSDAVLFQFACTDGFRAQKQGKKNEGLIRDREAKNGKHDTLVYRLGKA